ncbi:MAG TPA: HigA family addiction module antitoxin [Gammaproteobacteria bacterium]|nr:HigA family addiction module antitoxin [Gammaproteobacteria bacterium]
MAKKLRKHAHPGHILQKEFMKPLQLSQYRLAKELQVSPIRISQIMHGKRAISADTALRLGYLLNMDPLFWMHLQNAYDLETAIQTFDQAVYKKIKPLVGGKIKNQELRSKKPSLRPAGGTAKNGQKPMDFSALLQASLDHFLLNLEVDQKLRK